MQLAGGDDFYSAVSVTSRGGPSNPLFAFLKPAEWLMFRATCSEALTEFAKNEWRDLTPVRSGRLDHWRTCCRSASAVALAGDYCLAMDTVRLLEGVHEVHLPMSALKRVPFGSVSHYLRNTAVTFTHADQLFAYAGQLAYACPMLRKAIVIAMEGACGGGGGEGARDSRQLSPVAARRAGGGARTWALRLILPTPPRPSLSLAAGVIAAGGVTREAASSIASTAAFLSRALVAHSQDEPQALAAAILLRKHRRRRDLGLGCAGSVRGHSGRGWRARDRRRARGRRAPLPRLHAWLRVRPFL